MLVEAIQAAAEAVSHNAVPLGGSAAAGGGAIWYMKSRLDKIEADATRRAREMHKRIDDLKDEVHTMAVNFGQRLSSLEARDKP